MGTIAKRQIERRPKLALVPQRGWVERSDKPTDDTRRFHLVQVGGGSCARFVKMKD